MRGCVALHVSALLHFIPQFLGVFILRNIIETTLVIGYPTAVEPEIELAVVAAVILTLRLLITTHHPQPWLLA